MADDYPLRDVSVLSANPTRRKFYIQLPMLLYYFNFKFADPVYVNQISYQVCVTTLQINRTTCDKLELTDNGLRDFKDLETQIQPYTTDVVTIQKIIETIVPAFLSFFIGSWSDRYGRKPLFLAAHIGRAVKFLVVMIVTGIGNVYAINPYWYVLGSLGIAFSGGYAVNTIAMYAYVAETSKNSDRANRMGSIEGTLYFGLFLGSITTSHILRWIGTTTLFGIAFTLTVISVLYIALLLDEKAKLNCSTSKMYKDLFNYQLVTDVFKTCLQKRHLCDRAIIWLIFGGLFLNVFVFTGTFHIIYLFFREQFTWTIKDFSLFEAYTTFIQALGLLLIGFVLRKYKNLTGASIAVIGCLSCMIYYAILAIATESYQVYVVETLAFLKASISPMWRAILSNIVNECDIGKIYTFTSALESLTPFFSAPLYGWFYKGTLTLYTGAVHLMSMSLYIICGTIGIVIVCINKKYYDGNFSYKNMHATDEELIGEID